MNHIADLIVLLGVVYVKLPRFHLLLAPAVVVLASCNAPSIGVPSPVSSLAPSVGQSILVTSAPLAGSIVRAPVNEIRLRFNPPARLDEVLVQGPQGTMPMMVHAVGEVSEYALPLSGVGPGSYTVNWKATSGGAKHQGSFGFTVTG